MNRPFVYTIFLLLILKEAASEIKCGGKLEAGYMESPSYPYLPKQKVSCSWVFDDSCIQNSSQWVYMNFDDFSLDGNDTLTINSSYGLQTFSGRKAPFMVIIDAKSADITFRSVEGNSTFHATYDCNECKIRLHFPNHMLSLPVYPTTTTETVQPILCVWILVAPSSGLIVDLSFIKMNLTDNKNFLSVYDGQSMESKRLLGNLTGDNLPADILSSQYAMMVSLKLTTFEPNQLFLAEYIIVSSKCSVTKTIDSREVVYPPHDDQISKQICVWIYKTSENSTFLLNFEDLHVHGTDALYIIDGDRRNSDVIQMYSAGLQAIPDMMSSSNKLYIYFHARRVETLSTFKLALETQVSGGLYKNNGSFTLPDVKSRGNKTIIFNFMVPSEKQMKINITEPKKLNAGNLLSIYDIFDNKRELLATFDSTTSLFPVFSKSNKVAINATNFGAKDTLRGNFEDINPGCNQFDSASIGSYQLKHGLNKDCLWIIRLNETEYPDISLTFSTLNLQKNETVKIYRGSGNLVETLHSNITFYPTIQMPASEGITIDSSLSTGSDIDNELIRVSAFYEVIPDCNKDISLISEEIAIKSPGYPTRYSMNAKCAWGIKIPVSKTLLLHVGDVDIYEPDSLQVYAIENKTVKTFLYNITRLNVTNDVIVTKNISITWNSSFVHSISAPVRGFNLSVEVLDCGGPITADTGSFQIPPKEILNINGSVQCIWIIDVAAKKPEHGNDVYIIDFHYKPQNKSSLNALQIFDGGSMSDELFPPFDNDTSILSRTNKVILRYVIEDKEAKPIFEFGYKTKTCDKAHQCKNGICMHEEWRCNGQNNCGDYSDEDNCNSPPPVQSGSISGGIFALGIILAIVVGVVCTLAAPKVIQKIAAHRQRYHDFRTLNED